MSQEIQKLFFGVMFYLMLVLPSAAQEGGSASASGNPNVSSGSYNAAYVDQVNVSVGIAISNSPTTNAGAASDSVHKKAPGSTDASSWGPVLHSSTGAQKSLSSGWSGKSSKSAGSEAQSSYTVSRPGETKSISSRLRHSSDKPTGVRRSSQQASASDPDSQVGNKLGGQASKQRHSTLTASSTQSSGNGSIARHGDRESSAMERA